MPYAIRAALVLFAGVAVSALPAQATEQRRAQPAYSAQANSERPVKDCTRYNGTYGFYGNRWCTAEEQERWDRWEARRITGR